MEMGCNSQSGSLGEESTCNAGDCLQHRRPRFSPWVRKISWRRKWQSTPIFLPGKPHGRGAWWVPIHGVTEVGHDFTTKLQPHMEMGAQLP